MKKLTRRGRKNERGAALLLALTAITILAAFSVEFAYNMRVSVHQEANLRREVQAYFNARSGMEIARAVIFADKRFNLSILSGGKIQPWRYACKFAEVFATGKAAFLGQELLDLSESDGIGVDNGGFQCEIIAEDGKINVAKVTNENEQTQVFSALYGLLSEYFGHDQMQTPNKDAIDLVMSIIDWVDTDESRSDLNDAWKVVSTGGAEGGAGGYSRYGYESRNAKPDSNEELRLIEGMTDELFCQIASKLTVYETGKLDVGEAEIDVLKSLICQYLQGDVLSVCAVPSVMIQTPMGAIPFRLVDLVAERLQVCRMIASELQMPAFGTAAKFSTAVKMAAAEYGQTIQLDETALGKVIGFKPKVVRVRTRGYVTNKKNKVLATKTLEAVVNTSTDAFLYWREF